MYHNGSCTKQEVKLVHIVVDVEEQYYSDVRAKYLRIPLP